MDRDVERFISECEICRRGTVRRRHLKMIFDADAPLAKVLPRQHYGLDFYGVLKGEILVIVDLFSREVIITGCGKGFTVAVLPDVHAVALPALPATVETAPKLSRGPVRGLMYGPVAPNSRPSPLFLNMEGRNEAE